MGEEEREGEGQGRERGRGEGGSIKTEYGCGMFLPKQFRGPVSLTVSHVETVSVR